MVILFLTVYLISKGFTLTQAGVIMTIFGTGSIFGSFFGGWLTDRFGFFIVQFCSLFFSGILFFVLGYMQSIEQIALCIFILSVVGEAFRPANAAAIVAYSNPQNRTRSYSLNRLAINIGFSLGPAIGGLLASVNYSLLFWVDGMTCIAASLVLYGFLHSYEITISKTEEVPARSLPAHRDTVFLKGMFLLLLVAVCFFQTMSIVPVFYKEEAHLSESVIGLVLALNGVIIALFEMVLVYKLEAKGKIIQYLVLGSALIGIAYLVLIINKSLFIIVASVVIITLGEMLLFPFINNFWVSRTNQYNRGRYAALFAMTFSLSQVLAPTISSQIAANAGFNTLWVTNFLLCVIAAASFYFFLKKNGYEQ